MYVHVCDVCVCMCLAICKGQINIFQGYFFQTEVLFFRVKSEWMHPASSLYLYKVVSHLRLHSPISDEATGMKMILLGYDWMW